MDAKTLQILVISLESSKERRKAVQQELKDIPLDWSFLDAVNGRELAEIPKEYKPYKVKRLLGFELTQSEIGCFLSHKEAWLACVDKNKPTLIFEDDFCLLSSFMETLEVFMDQYKEWDIARLHGLTKPEYHTITEINGVGVVSYIGDPLGTACYIIRPDAAKRLLHFARFIYEPVDHFLENTKKHHLQIVAPAVYPVSVREAQTTITDRPQRTSVRGFAKHRRSFWRALDRLVSKEPWF